MTWERGKMSGLSAGFGPHQNAALGSGGGSCRSSTALGAAVEGRWQPWLPVVPQCPAALGVPRGWNRAQPGADAALLVYSTRSAIAEGAAAVFALGSCWMPCRPGSRSPIKYPSVTRKTNAQIPSAPH